MRTPTNPFVLSGYHSPAYFCNRDKEWHWLKEQFQNERNTVLYAYRRMGKTALIKHFFYHLEKEKMAKTVFVDLLGTRSMSEANKRLATAIYDQFGRRRGGIGKTMLELLSAGGATIGLDPLSGTPQVSLTLVKAAEVERSMGAMGNFLKGLKQPVVIAIDEFQQITTYAEQDAEAIFRFWTQEFPMIRFIFSGSHRHMMQTLFTEHHRPFYNSAQLWSLEPIDETDYTSFIQTFFGKAGLQIREEILTGIFDWCRGQTYYIQLMCNKLYGRQQEVDSALVRDIQQEIIQQEAPLFSTYQQLLTDFQWRTLKAIALQENVPNPTSKAFLSDYDLGAASSVSTALSLLVKKEFVVQHDSHYRLHDTLLMRWLQQL